MPKLSQQEPEVTPIPRKPVRPIRGGMNDEITLLGHRNQVYVATPQIDNLDPADCLEPGFWFALGGILRVGDEIVLYERRMKWRQHLVVIETSPAFVRVAEISFVDLSKTLAAAALVQIPNHEILDLGPSGYSIKRTSDSVVMASGFASAEAALTYLRSHASFN